LKVGAFLFEVLLLLVLLEVGVRLVVPPQVDVPHLQVSAKGFYTWYPNSRFTYHNLPGVEPTSSEVRINEHGLRGDPIPPEKAANERRILILGDSFTAAVQLDEDVIFTTLLQRQLEADASDVHFRVINAGFNGVGTVEELLYFLDQGPGLRPDVVVLVYTFNDPVDNLKQATAWRGRRMNSANGVPPSSWEASFLAARDWLGNRSLAFYLLYKLAQKGAKKIGTRDAAAGDAEVADPALALFDELLGKLLARADGLGVPVIVLTIPSPIDVAGTGPAWQRLHVRVRERLAGTRNQLVTLSAPFTDAIAHGQQPYLAHDGHLDVAGHRIVAAELARAVRRALIPTGARSAQASPRDAAASARDDAAK